MRSIRGLALGTYYAVGASGASMTLNAMSMRGLLYAVKDNRTPPNPPQLIADRRHPSSSAGVMVDRNNAAAYVADLAGANIERVRKLLAIRSPVVLVPIPSSEVTASTVGSARWPALRLAQAFARVGLGVTRVLTVNKNPVAGKTLGGPGRSIDEIVQNLELVDGVPRHSLIVLVDDTVTSGASVVAMDTVLGRPDGIRVFAVGLTDTKQTEDAFRSRRFSVEYDPDESPVVPLLLRED